MQANAERCFSGLIKKVVFQGKNVSPKKHYFVLNIFSTLSNIGELLGFELKKFRELAKIA